MIMIDNDYTVNERGFDVRAEFKGHANPSNIATIFFKQLSYRVYDYIITNSINFDKRSHVDDFLNKDTEMVDDFKRALAEQAIYLISNGDLALMMPDGVNYSDWLNMRISPATIDVLRRLHLLRQTASDEELFYNDNAISKKVGDLTRNW